MPADRPTAAHVGAARTARRHDRSAPLRYAARTYTVEQVGGVDVLLLDPPWPNQSAARAHRATHHDVRATRHAYETLSDLYDIWRLRPTLEPLLVHRPLLAVWITNHVGSARALTLQPKVHRFVRDKLLPQLGLRYLGAWAWLKLAQDGASLYTLAHPRRRRPYELLVLAAHEARDVPPQVIASVALAHSQKPYVVGACLLVCTTYHRPPLARGGAELRHGSGCRAICTAYAPRARRPWLACERRQRGAALQCVRRAGMITASSE